MAIRLRSRRWWLVLAVIAACYSLYIVLFEQIDHPSQTSNRSEGKFSSLSLSHKECRAAFPGLFDPIDKQLVQGQFDLPISASNDLGPMLVRIDGRQLHILSTEKHGLLPPELLDARVAALHQINHAVITSPEPIGPTVVAVNIQDQPFGSAWTYSLPAYRMPSAGNAPIGRSFLMPHFSFWAWRPAMVGSLPRAAREIDRIESAVSFRDKDPRVVWRGTARFASAHHPNLRTDLLAATHNQTWADVQALDWLSDGSNTEAHQEASNALPIEDFCRYKYIVYTEGITYSGRLHFHQLCNSVVITPPIAWMQHTTHLVKPLFAGDVLGSNKEKDEVWTHASVEDANMVFVAADWSDLGAVIGWLEAHPDVAEGIARRQRELFSGRGYTSPAAETCYWRELLRGWRQAAVYNETLVDEMTEKSIPWELFSLSPRD